MEECCICLDNIDIDNSNIVYIINEMGQNEKDKCNCNINLHSDCFFQWYKNNMTCPICRNKLDNSQLFFNNENDFKELDRINKDFSEKNSEIPDPSSELLNTLFNEINQYRIYESDRSINRNRVRRNAIIEISDFRHIHDIDSPEVNPPRNINNRRRRGFISYLQNLFR